MTPALPWLDRARELYLPRAVESLIVRAWFASPVAADVVHGLRLESALGWVVVAHATGEPPPEGFAGVPRGTHVDIPVPIADVWMEGRPIACASDVQLPGDDAVSEVVRVRRQRTHPEAFAAAKVITSGGPYANAQRPTAALTTPCAWWHVRADRERLEALLSDLHALGKGRAGGLGHVAGWEVLPDPDDASLVRDGRPMRPLPVRDREDAAERYPGATVREASVRAPSWHRATRCLCVVPAC